VIQKIIISDTNYFPICHIPLKIKKVEIIVRETNFINLDVYAFSSKV